MTAAASRLSRATGLGAGTARPSGPGRRRRRCGLRNLNRALAACDSVPGGPRAADAAAFESRSDSLAPSWSESRARPGRDHHWHSPECTPGPADGKCRMCRAPRASESCRGSESSGTARQTRPRGRRAIRVGGSVGAGRDLVTAARRRGPGPEPGVAGRRAAQAASLRLAARGPPSADSESESVSGSSFKFRSGACRISHGARFKFAGRRVSDGVRRPAAAHRLKTPAGPADARGRRGPSPARARSVRVGLGRRALQQAGSESAVSRARDQP